MFGTHFSLFRYLELFTTIVATVPIKVVEGLADALYSAWSQGHNVFVCGEGTGATNVRLVGEHMPQSIRGQHSDLQKRLHVLSLTDYRPNGAHREGILQTLQKTARPEDLLIALSARHPSPQVLKAVEWSNSAGLVTWAFTGHEGIRLKKQAQHHLAVPLTDVGMVEAIHLVLMHWVLDDVAARIHQMGRYAEPEVVTVEN